MAESSRQRETIKYHEAYLEDVYDGIVSLDRMLELISGGETDVLSRRQMISIASYITGHVANGLDDLQQVNDELPDNAKRQLDEYHQRFKKQHAKLARLKLLG